MPLTKPKKSSTTRKYRLSHFSQVMGGIFRLTFPIIGESFTVAPDTYKFLIETVRNPHSHVDIWILKVDDEIVSTVTTILVDEVLARSASKGAKLGILSASTAGKLLYDKSGWKTLEEWDVYLSSSTRKWMLHLNDITNSDVFSVSDEIFQVNFLVEMSIVLASGS